jgi:hypothetical protein
VWFSGGQSLEKCQISVRFLPGRSPNENLQNRGAGPRLFCERGFRAPESGVAAGSLFWVTFRGRLVCGILHNPRRGEEEGERVTRGVGVGQGPEQGDGAGGRGLGKLKGKAEGKGGRGRGGEV